MIFACDARYFVSRIARRMLRCAIRTDIPFSPFGEQNYEDAIETYLGDKSPVQSTSRECSIKALTYQYLRDTPRGVDNLANVKLELGAKKMACS